VSPASTFKRLGSRPPDAVTLYFQDRPVDAREGESVAAALLAAGHRVLRSTPARGTPRGPYCMMGVCFECLVEIDGEPNCQACMVAVRDGMRVQPMDGARSVSISRD
jgi:succinate dehydrogenase/fumarate reductase-like Fe-S protein